MDKMLYVAIRKLILIGAMFSHYIINAALDGCRTNSQRINTQNKIGNTIQIFDSHFANISGGGVIIYVQVDSFTHISNIHNIILNCTFRHIKSNIILQTHLRQLISYGKLNHLVGIENTSFTVINCTIAVILFKETSLSFDGPLI